MKLINHLLLAAAVMLTTTPITAQENVRRHFNLFNPSIDTATCRATFVVNAPDAHSVNISGDFAGSPLVLVRDSDSGLWQGVTDSLTSELYTYHITIDGVEVCDPTNPYQVRDIAGIANILIIPGGKADNYLAHDVPHGTVSKVWYHSPTLGHDRRTTIYTPPGYESGDTRYPVLYLLHGMGGDEDSWSDLGRVSFILDNMIASHKIRPMIVVMPNGNARQWAAPGYTGQGLYQPSGALSVGSDGQFENSFNEIVDYVDSNYRTINNRAHRAIAGLSMGGGHSWRISAINPQMFDYVGLFSAKVGWKGDPADDYTQQEMEQQMSSIIANPPHLYCIYIGKDDFLLENNMTFENYLNSKDFKHDLTLSGGGHMWRNWRDYLVDFLPRLFAVGVE